LDTDRCFVSLDEDPGVEPPHPAGKTLNEGEALSFRLPIERLFFYEDVFNGEPGLETLTRMVVIDGENKSYTAPIRVTLES
jgi:hypothetical protein